MKKYIKDYENVVQTDEFGFERKVPVYIGQYFEVNLDETRLRRVRGFSLLLIGLIVIGQLAVGFIANQAMYSFYISLPYVFSFLPLFFLIDSALRIPKEKRNYKREEVELSFKRLKSATNFMMALIGIGILGEIVFLIFFSQGFDLKELVFLLVELLVGVSVYLLMRMQKQIKVMKIVGNEEEKIVDSVNLTD
jgi:MFS family permease